MRSYGTDSLLNDRYTRNLEIGARTCFDPAPGNGVVSHKGYDGCSRSIHMVPDSDLSFLHGLSSNPPLNLIRIILRIACLVSLTISAAHSAQTVTFEHVYLEHRLSQSTAQCIYIDSRGLIWIGTQAGLDVYDDSRCTYSEPTEKIQQVYPTMRLLPLPNSHQGSCGSEQRAGHISMTTMQTRSLPVLQTMDSPVR